MFDDNHFAVISANDINNICNPLFKSSPITLFEFKRVFADGSYIILGSNREFVKKLSAVIWTSKDLELIKNRFQPSKRYYPLYTYNQNPACMLTIDQEFNINHGLLIKETYISHQDNYRFTSQKICSNIYEYIFNNIDFLEKFIFYFKDKASRIIKKATLEKRIYLSHPEIFIIQSLLNSPTSKENHEVFNTGKYFFTMPEGLISLSAQELNSVKLLAKGCTIKEAAQILNLSPRTIDYYLKCAREKLQLNTNRQLISIYWKALNLA